MRPMSPQEWIGLALRWSHLIAGIAWIGGSFYFIWLDRISSCRESGAARRRVEGRVDDAQRRVLSRSAACGGPGPHADRPCTGSSGRRRSSWITGLCCWCGLRPRAAALPPRSGVFEAVVPAWRPAFGLERHRAGRGSPTTGCGNRRWARTRPRLATVVSLAIAAGATMLFLSGAEWTRRVHSRGRDARHASMVANVWVRILPARSSRMIDATAAGRATNPRRRAGGAPNAARSTTAT